MDRLSIAILYPTPDTGEDDFLALAGRVTPSMGAEIVYMPWPGDRDMSSMGPAEITDALRRLGSDSHLAGAVPAALGERRPDIVVFGVTSASFLQGADGVSVQVALLERVSGIRATTTTAAFQAAIRQLGLRTVSVASVYPPRITDHFISRVEEAGAAVVHRADAGAGSDHEVGAWSGDQIARLVERAASPGAEAVLLPETALHAATITRQLERAAGGAPVLTATQVTLWHAATLAGLTPHAEESGPLFAGAS
jgi:maleate cis-trans isomerase